MHAVVVGAMPSGDRGYIAVRAFDVFTDRTPLVGALSAGATDVVGQVAYSPGPLLYWPLSLPARFLDESFMEVTAGVVNVACIVWALVLTRRRGGLPLRDRLEEAIPSRGATRVDGTSFDALAFEAGAIYALRRDGKAVVATGAERVLGDVLVSEAYPNGELRVTLQPRR